MVHLSKTLCGIFRFRFRLVFTKVYIFVQQKAWKLQNLNRQRPPIFKLQQEVWKFNYIWVSWSSPKSNLEMNFLYLENFFSIVAFNPLATNVPII